MENTGITTEFVILHFVISRMMCTDFQTLFLKMFPGDVEGKMVYCRHLLIVCQSVTMLRKDNTSLFVCSYLVIELNDAR